uniref:uncharacterized protein LOC122591668 n=1 Tax=Erigeron canadensis TaxID=72917 RepID=UPI001CB8F084|nr:uncharacterized protein LOC122591668 [Erigeron canadensis]
MEAEGEGRGKKKKEEFLDIIFSWSLDDILNQDLYKSQVDKIPLTFDSEQQYFSSFVNPLLEETRAELASSLEIIHRYPSARVFSIHEARHDGKAVYDVKVGPWRNRSFECGKPPYQTLPGDLLIFMNGKAETVSDLQRIGRTWAFSLVSKITESDNEDDSEATPSRFTVKASQPLKFQDGMFVVFLKNIKIQTRIWDSLHMNGNLNIIKAVLGPDSMVKETCNACSFDFNSLYSQNKNVLDKLNESQRAAVMVSLVKTECCHHSYVEQIRGPPGTGKTTTVSVLLLILMQMNRRTLTCAPTNVALLQLASRVLSLVKESFKTTTANGDSFCSFGDILLFGSEEQLKVGVEMENIYLEHRVERLTECLGSSTGWKHCIRSMNDLLENCVSQYYVFLENQLFKETQMANENHNQSESESKTNKLQVKSFLEFLQDRFSSSVMTLRRCILTFLTHVPISFMKEYIFYSMIHLLDNLSSFESFLFEENLVSEELEHLFTSKPFPNESEDMSSINSVRAVSIFVLRSLRISLEKLGLPDDVRRHVIEDFCFERASLVFCTTSNSYKLHMVAMKPLNILVIDEAAQLKEAESTIPLQLPGMKHAILIGDECQLPAMVTSNVCFESGFGRSLFERLSFVGHSRYLLNVQYRMHPSISFFPNWRFYQNQILDAENVLCESCEKQYLPGPMFGSYSFINIVGGREEKDDNGQSKTNMVEVAIVIKILQNLYKAWKDSKKNLTVGVVSPYAAQVAMIQEKLAHKYEKLDGFLVKVKSIDDYQGGEEDIIILSTVRSNSRGSVGVMYCPQTANFVLTRARHCLWILGNERTLTRSKSVWEELVYDARNRHCLFDADSDECLKMTVIKTKKELEQFDDLVNENSILLKHAKWKVLFSDDFRRSFGKLTTARSKKLVLNLLLRLSGGWRPKNRSVDLHCVKSSHILKQFKVAGLYVMCTIDVIMEFNYVQVLKVWDVLPFEEIPKLTKRLENIFSAYTDDYINRCTEKCVEGNLEVPKSWMASEEVIRFCFVRNPEPRSCDGKSHVENSKVNESLLLMKFYPLSDGVVKHLLSDKEQLDLPMQVSDEQMEIILFSKSSFIIGRSGTGKTTILTMKLFQNEESFYVASDGISEGGRNCISDSEVDESKGRKPSVLRQLFVTVSPNLCHFVKQHVSHLTSISCNGNTSLEVNLDDPDLISDFSDIADTFIDIPVKNYPLFITFHKFLMMLDGTLGNSFFERFPKTREASHGNHTSSRSVALQTFLRLREVTYDRFCTLYWPHFNSSLTKKLDPSRVFTEIISHIKGGLHAGECSDGKLTYEGYCLLAESRSSTLTKQKRESIYYLYQAYEKMKSERGEFDLADLVCDLHQRLTNGRYEGDIIDFVYIDEVQDLSMRQISLFKYICQNIDEGFIFAGDTAQTIARGIDFRFQDIRSLFYKEFLTERVTGKQEKALVSEVFQLKQNFRTHAGVLELAQSVIDILYCYFVHAIDILEPETSLISGEAPVLLESSDNENAIVTIFGGSGSGGEIVSFGADQVILVCDDCVKIEISEYVGKNALVLTILECKGLEFQDVLLYNFFGTSPLKDQWRVIYGYMKERDWLDENLPQSFPTFSEARHSVLCSELKQLYVAITRTRQRLWVCENKEELSKPIFDYWKRRGLAQIRKLDDSVAQAMRVSSSPQEWRERGKKLFYENNFVMATMCFERAGDTMWEKLAKASGLRASADQMRGKNPEAYLCYLREATELFESIGKFESAASCYCDLEEYERAGKAYLYKCRKTNTAAECFTLAGCYSDAAEAYAKGDQVSNCLSVCIKGKLFDKGLQYIEYWNKHLTVRTKEIEQTEQRFLESCALDCYEHKDLKSMMKFVRAFCSMESKHVFLRSLGCLDDLLSLEEESGHFLDAVELARSLGYVLKEADLLEKAGHCREAALLLLWYVCFSSLWENGGRGWPLKQFSKKEDLCEKARSLAKLTSDHFFDFVCNELEVLSDQHSSLPELMKVLLTSQKNKSLRGEILSVRKILDSHFHIHFSKYFWEDDLPSDFTEHCENRIFQSCVSVRTLVFYWNRWKANVMIIFQSIKCLVNEEPNKHEELADFSISYFGVRKQCVNGNMVYLLVNKDGDWIRTAGNNSLHCEGELIFMNISQLVCAIRSYWQSELLSVGMKVLLKLESLYKSKSNGSAFHQSTSLVHIFEVSKFLLDCQCLNLASSDKKKLQSYLGISARYFDHVFPLDWRRSVCEDMVSLRLTDLSLNLLDEIILQNVNNNGNISYWTIGRVMMVCLCSRKSVTLNEMIMKGLQWAPKWTSAAEVWNSEVRDMAFFPMFKSALIDTFWSGRVRVGCISPHCFVYLLDRVFFVESYFYKTLFTKKSSFVGWFTHLHPTDKPVLPAVFLRFNVKSYLEIIEEILSNKEDTESWIQRSNMEVSYYYPLLVLQLVMMVTLACLQEPSFSEKLFNLLTGSDNIASLLPEKFVDHLLCKKKGDDWDLCPQMVAEAFISVEDPLLIVSTEKPHSEFNAPDAIFVDLEKSKQEIASALFPGKAVVISQFPSNIEEHVPLRESEEKCAKDDNKKLLFSFLEQLQPPSAVEEVKRIISSALEKSEAKGGKKKAVQAMAKRGAGKEQAKRLMDDAFVEDVCKKFLEEGSSSKTSEADENAKRKGKGKSKNKKGKKKKS